MRHAWLLAVLVLVPGGLSGQAPAVLHVTVTLRDAAQAPTPVARHALLISDNPASAAPKRVLTGADGTVAVTLRPGSYIVESDEPIVFQGKAYQWTEVVVLAAGRDLTLHLSADNAAEVGMPAPAAASAAGVPPQSDPSFLFAKWHDSVVAVWSPTSRASGFVLDAQGLIATARSAVGGATAVEVQLGADVKVSGRVVFSSPGSDAAVVWIHPALLAGRPALPLECPPAAASSLDDGDEVITIALPFERTADQALGVVTGLAPRRIDTDLRLGFGGAGGPVFNRAGAVVGLTSLPDDVDPRMRSEVTIVRAGLLCEAVAAARTAMTAAAPPEATRLPVEPHRPFPAPALTAAASERTTAATPPTLESSDFDVALLTPAAVHRARQRAAYTGGTPSRSPEAEARLGRLTEFGPWSAYFAHLPPVLVVRVTPKLVEGFWKRLAREAARTQGAALPPFKDFATSFLRMTASCGSAEVVPIHPFVIEHRIPEKDPVREGLYVFDPGALTPACGGVTLTLFSERAPDRGQTLAIHPATLERLWQDFAPYRAAGG